MRALWSLARSIGRQTRSNRKKVLQRSARAPAHLQGVPIPCRVVLRVHLLYLKRDLNGEFRPREKGKVVWTRSVSLLVEILPCRSQLVIGSL